MTRCCASTRVGTTTTSIGTRARVDRARVNDARGIRTRAAARRCDGFRRARDACVDERRSLDVTMMPSMDVRRVTRVRTRRRASGAGDAATAASEGNGTTDAIATRELWRRAIKVPMYSVAWIPLVCAGALTWCHVGRVGVANAMELVAGATLVVAWLNLSNDAFDAATTVDARKAESVVRLMGGKVLVVHALAVACLVVGGVLLWNGCAASAWARRALGAAVALGYAYQGPPFRLSYKGLGEPICFLAFGPLATTAFYLAMVNAVSATAVASAPAVVYATGVLVGCTTAFILFTSHFHQEEGDRAAGKLSPIVRLGLPGALLVADNVIGAHYATIATLAAAGWLPYTTVFALIATYPLARHIVDYSQAKAEAGRVSELFFAKYLAVRFHVVHGVALALGLVAQRALLSPELFFP